MFDLLNKELMERLDRLEYVKDFILKKEEIEQKEEEQKKLNSKPEPKTIRLKGLEGEELILGDYVLKSDFENYKKYIENKLYVLEKKIMEKKQ